MLAKCPRCNSSAVKLCPISHPFSLTADSFWCACCNAEFSATWWTLWEEFHLLKQMEHWKKSGLWGELKGE